MARRNVIDTLTSHTYGVPDVVDFYEQFEGHTDPGERRALSFVAEECHGTAILDLGVGGGRTVPLLRAISQDYRAVDSAASMVKASRRRYPNADIRHGDARRLEGIEDGSLGLVVFSYNGIDSVSHDDRLAILRSVQRVLVPGGLFLFSSHNRNGPVTRPQPFSLPPFPTARNPFRLSLRALRYARSAAISLRNERRYRRHDVWHDDYAIVFCGAHDHGLMIYHATRDCAVRQLRDAGFSKEVTLFANDGARVEAADDVSQAGWFHYVARK